MSLKAIIDQAAAIGADTRDLVNTAVSLQNKIAADSAKLPKLLAKHGLSGGILASGDEHIQALLDAVPVPTDAEISAASGGLFGVAEIATVKQAIRLESVLRFVAGYLVARQPVNDI